MVKFNKITIIGVGLIGGSIGLAIKDRRLAREVTGVFRRRSTLRKALRYKAVDKGTMDIAKGVRSADLIILATPVGVIPKLAYAVARNAKRGALITDVGSTKFWVVNEIEKILKSRPSVFFVGSHPMAGSEQTGVESARRGLLKGSPCIVTRTKRTDKKALRHLIAFWKALGANVEVMSPEAHDRSVSLISHLPHLVAFSLAGTIPAQHLTYAAEGFKDTTRVASSDPKLWTDIFISNRDEVLRAARLFERYYKKVISSLSKKRYSKMAALLKYAKAKRDKFVY